MFTQKQKSLIIGSVLGDGYLTKPKVHKQTGKPNGHTQLSIEHNGNQLEYLIYKRELFINNGFKVSKIYDVSRKYPSYRFNVTLGKEGSILRHQLYPNNDKTITRHHLNMLDAEGLAIWFMDDGNKRVRWLSDGRCGGRSLGISTHGFSLEEHEIFIKYFKTVWNVEVKAYKDKDYYRLNMNATNAQIFIPIIHPYICESMKYKIDLEYKI